MALTSDNWIRRFLVTDPQRHRKGFTVYKVTSIVYPKLSPEAITKVVVWKRYNDFKKLHRELQQRHQKLYLKDQFPPFCKSTLFGRFEEVVVEERRLCALKLLDFCAQHPPLFTSQVFVKFFESGYSMGHHATSGVVTDSEARDESGVAVTLMDNDPEVYSLPEPGLRPLGPGTPRLASIESLSDTNVDTSSLQGGDHLSFIDQDTTEHTSDSDDYSEAGALAAELPCSSESREGEPELQFFDPLQPDEGESRGGGGGGQSNQQLLENFESDRRGTESSQQPRPGSPESCHGAGYIFEAACLVSRAQQLEVNGSFEAAFTSYKAGIAALLAGVQGDGDGARRQIVKEKTAKYLLRAESIYNTHLAPDSLTCTIGEPVDSEVASLSRPAAELARYKVLGVVGRRCMLVVDIGDPNTCCVLKAAYKSPCPVRPDAGLVLPFHVPFMVPLIRFHETDSAVFMLLHHVSGGRLWDQLGSYVGATQLPGSGGTGADRPISERDAYLGLRLVQGADNDLGMADLNMNCSPDNEGCVTLHQDENGIGSAKFSWSGIETKALVQNAQKLLQSVSATLQRSEQAVARSEQPGETPHPTNPNKDLPAAEKTHQEGRVRSRGMGSSARSKSSTAAHLTSSRARLIERRFSSEDLLEGRTGSSSLEGRGGYSGHQRPPSALLVLQRAPRLPEARVQLWAAQLVLALQHLHDARLIFRDLSPNNILLGPGGCALLTFTAQWPGVDPSLDPAAVEDLYVAPEARGLHLPSKAADWWSLGAILYELLVGKTLVSCHPGGIFSHTLLHMPDFVSPEGASLLSELLKPDPYERLGSGSHGIENLKSHPFFHGINWNQLREAGFPFSP